MIDEMECGACGGPLDADCDHCCAACLDGNACPACEALTWERQCSVCADCEGCSVEMMSGECGCEDPCTCFDDDDEDAS